MLWHSDANNKSHNSLLHCLCYFVTVIVITITVTVTVTPKWFCFAQFHAIHQRLYDNPPASPKTNGHKIHAITHIFFQWSFLYSWSKPTITSYTVLLLCRIIYSTLKCSFTLGAYITKNTFNVQMFLRPQQCLPHREHGYSVNTASGKWLTETKGTVYRRIIRCRVLVT